MPDSNTIPVENTTPEENTGMKIKINKRKLFITLGVLIVLIGGITLYFFSQNTPKIGNTDVADTSSESGETKKPDTAIAKVGDEYIYQKDLDIELATYPVKKDEKVRKMLLEKLIKDSITLQAAKKNKLLSSTALDKTTYNSPDKNYMKRIENVKAVEEKIEQNLDQISGVIVSIWFHNMFPPKMGLETAKKEAFRRVSELRKRVATKEITIEDAGRLVTTDETLAELDPGYQNNGYVPFHVKWGKRITIDDKFDAFILKLKPGQVSEVFLGRNVNSFTDKLEEAFYAFVVVKEKVDNGSTKDYTAWYNDQKKNYEITYY